MAREDILRYAEMAHEASLHGGPDSFEKDLIQKGFDMAMDLISSSDQQSGYNKGYAKGAVDGSILTGVVGLGLLTVTGAVLWGRKKWIAHQARVAKEKQLATQAETAKETLHSAIVDDTIELPTEENPSIPEENVESNDS